MLGLAVRQDEVPESGSCRVDPWSPIFDGRHRFELEETSGGTNLTQSEDFRGALVRFMRRSLDSQTLKGFAAMNATLRVRAEARVSSEETSSLSAR